MASLDLGYETPDCVIYCNSQHFVIKDWLENVARKVVDLEADPRNELKIEVSSTRGQLFKSLVRNIPKMFPRHLLDVEIQQEENQNEIYVVIKLTTEEIRAKKKA